jgi:hypothetical protein
MRCYFNLVSSHQTLTDDEGLEVTDVEEAHTFAREAVTEMLPEGVVEIARWQGWEVQARDASGTVLFTMSLDALLPAETRRGEPLRKEGGIQTHDKAA